MQSSEELPNVGQVYNYCSPSTDPRQSWSRHLTRIIPFSLSFPHSMLAWGGVSSHFAEEETAGREVTRGTVLSGRLQL